MGLPPTESKSAVFYSYEVKVNGQKVGTLQSFSPSSTRDLERIREIAYSDIDTLEIVPGRTEHQLQIDKIELYTKSLIEALGYEPVSISDLSHSLTIVETMHRPDGTKRKMSYDRCWINSWNKQINANNVTITESVTLWPTGVTVLPE